MNLRRVGLQKTTLIDYPGMVASTVFTQGCNLRCPYCHNPELVTGSVPVDFITTEQFFTFLKKRKNVLDGVCITGGEPLLYDDLQDFIEHIRHFGLKVKLDTNGTLPGRLKQLNVDYIAMDLKTVPGKYYLLTGADKYNADKEAVSAIAGKLSESLDYIKSSGINHEIRTTWVPEIIGTEDIPEMARLLDGIQSYFITSFRPGITLDPSYSNKRPATGENLKKVQEIFIHYGIPTSIR